MHCLQALLPVLLFTGGCLTGAYGVYSGLLHNHADRTVVALIVAGCVQISAMIIHWVVVHMQSNDGKNLNREKRGRP